MSDSSSHGRDPQRTRHRGPHGDAQLHLTGIPYAKSEELGQVDCTWSQFVGEIRHTVGEKDGPAFVPASFATYSEGRKKEHVEKIYLLAYDVDGVPPDEAEAMLNRLKFEGIAHTTFRHQPEQQRFRIVLLLRRSVTPDEFPALWKWGARLIGNGVDVGCKDISRLYYLPRIPDETARANAWVRRLEGERLDPDVVLNDVKAANEDVPPAGSVLAKVWPEEGQRQAFALALAGWVLRSGRSREEAEDLIRSAAVEAADEEVEARVGTVAQTVKKREADEPTTGFPSLVQILGEEKAQELAAALETDDEAVSFAAPEPERTPLPFPVEALPEELQAYALACAQAFGCPVDFFGVAMLVVASAMIGTSRAVGPKPSWAESPRLYAAIVADPGSAKTPAMNYVLKPVHEIQAGLSRLFEESFRSYEKEKKVYDKTFRRY